jgi:hypothetical protein
MSALVILNDNPSSWSRSYLVDRLKQNLATVEDREIFLSNFVIDNRKYYNRAYHFLKIGVFKPVPGFVVNLSDLTPKLIEELYQLDDYDRNYVLKQATGRIFEDVNFELYHNSVSNVLKVRLQS